MKREIVSLLGFLAVFQSVLLAEEWGVTSRFGFRVQEIPQAIRSVLPFEAVGIQVTHVFETSRAAKAGLRAGDILLKISGRWIKSTGHFESYLSGVPLDRELHLVIFRKGKNYEVKFHPVEPKRAPFSPSLEGMPAKEKPRWKLENAHITISCPIFCGPEDINHNTFYGAGIEAGYRVHDMISLSAQFFTCSEEITRDEVSIWTSLNIGVRLDISSIVKTRVANFFVRPGIVLSYLQDKGKVDFASAGFGISLIFGPEFKLSDAHTLGLFLGWDRSLMPHAGKRSGAVTPREYEYGKNSIYGGLCLRILFFGRRANRLEEE